MKLNDAVFGVLLCLLGAAVLIAVQGYPRIPGQQVGPALFPGLIATGLCVGGLVLVVPGLKARAQVPWLAMDEWVRSPRHVIGFVVLVGSVVFYIVAAERLGFFIAAPLVLAAMFLVLKVAPGRAVLFALVATLLIHFAFYKLLRVPLPWGVLTPYAW